MLPDLNLFGVEAVKVLLDASIELLGILKLLSVLHALGKANETVHWLLNSATETVAPVEGTSDNWHVAADR